MAPGAGPVALALADPGESAVRLQVIGTPFKRALIARSCRAQIAGLAFHEAAQQVWLGCGRESLADRHEAGAGALILTQVTKDLGRCELEAHLSRGCLAGLFDPEQGRCRILAGTAADRLQIEPVRIPRECGQNGVGDRFRIHEAVVAIGRKTGLGAAKGFLGRHRHLGGGPVFMRSVGSRLPFRHRNRNRTSRHDTPRAARPGLSRHRAKKKPRQTS